MKWWFMLKCWLLHRFNEILRENSTHKAIPGVYEREYYSGSIPVRDVLTVTSLSVLSDLYQVERRITPGDPDDRGRLEVRQEKWVAAYHMPTRQLVHSVGNKVCAFVPETGLVFFGDREYKRVIHQPFNLDTL